MGVSAVKKLLGVLAAVFFTGNALAQSVQQSGSVTPNTAAIWSGTGIIKGGVTATDSPLTTFGVTRNGVDAICVSSDRSTAVGRNQLCFQASTTGPAKISLQNYGTATAQDLQFVLNGVTLTLPSGGGTFITGIGPYVVGHAACFNSTTGIVQDCGVAIGAGTQFGLPYYSTASSITSTAAATNGQMLVGQTASAPLWKTLSGDVSSISSAGAVTLQSVNGIPFATSYTNHGVLLGQGTSAFVTATTGNVGYCLLSQGLASDPIWSPCASGSGSAGGAATQVQFNNSSALAGSANLTWVSPALTIGVAGTTTGQLQLAPSGSASGTVTIQNPSTTAAFNFNLPTGAGTSGQALLSGGGGATAMSFGTLGLAAGGTNCTVPSGTCLDNITSFSSLGYVQRTGAGTYAFSTQIPVSGGGTGLASGNSGGIPAYSASGTIASTATLTQYGLLVGGGVGNVPTAVSPGTSAQLLIAQTSANPSWNSMSGDATISASGVLTIANSAVTNAKLANAAAYTFKGNAIASSAAPTDFTPGSLTNKASPAAGDYIVIADNAAAGALKYATVSSVASAGSVSSIAGNTGAFTLTQPLNNAANAILLNIALRAGGRLTLTSGTPVLSTSVTAATAVYYTPYNGNTVPIYDGTNVIPTSFSELTVTLGSNWATNSNYDVFIASDAGTIRACTGPAWTSGSARGTGAGTTQLSYTLGLLLNTATVTCRYNNTTTFSVSAGRGTYVGSFRTGAAGQTNFVYGASGTAGLFGVWNNYNRVKVASTALESTVSWSYTSVTLRASNNTAIVRHSFISGLAEDSPFFAYSTRAFTTIGFNQISMGIDWSSGAGETQMISGSGGTGAQGFSSTTNYAYPPQLGFHYVQALEGGDGTNATTFYGTPYQSFSFELMM